MGLFDPKTLVVPIDSMAIPEGTDEVLRHPAKWMLCIHIKDFIVPREWHMMGFRVEGRPAGQGQLDIPRLLSSVKAHHPEANAILELWPPQQPQLSDTIALEHSWAVESMDYLRALVLA